MHNAWKPRRAGTTPPESAVEKHGGFDAVSLLTLYLVLLIGLPPRLTVSALGGAGSPAILLGLVALAWWAYAQVRRTEPTRAGPQPVRIALFAVLTAVAISYVVAMSRGLDPEESSTAHLGLLILLSWAGILLVANDGVVTWARFETFTRRLVFAAGALAALGVLQFVSGQLWVDRISIPGLSTSQGIGGFTSRGGFDRPPGTAVHAIEFGAVLTMSLPLAINLAITDGSRNLVRRWTPVALVSFAVVVSVTRSALICALIALLVLAVAWTPKIRRLAAGATVLFVTLVFLTIPGMIRTITSMFSEISTDSSSTSRVDSYAIAAEYIRLSPFFGRGFSTFLPKYRILDNQYLGLVIEIGFVGLLAVLTLLVAGFICSLAVRQKASDWNLQQSGQASAAALAAGAVGLALYDGLGFPMAGGFLFLVLGLAGAQWRLTRGLARHGASEPTPTTQGEA